MDQLLRIKRWKIIAVLGIVILGVLSAQALIPHSPESAISEKSGLVNSTIPSGLACKDQVNLSLGQNGYAVITPHLFLSGNISDYGRYEVEAMDPTVINDTITCQHVGLTMMVSVTDTITNNVCMSELVVLDKLRPYIDCSDADVPCYTDPFDISQFEDNPELYLDSIRDNCTPLSDLTVDFKVLNRVNPTNCNPDYVYRIVGEWTVSDAGGFSATCVQNINFVQPDIDSIVFPSDTMFQCGMENTDPSSSGFPTLDGRQLASLCNISVLMEDDSIPMCGNQYKLERVWTLMSLCPPVEMRSDTQVIEVKDTTAPIVICPADQVINTAPGICSADFDIILPEVQEDCADSASLNYNVFVDGVMTEEPTVSLSRGEHDIRVQVINKCNLKQANCTYTVTVVDNELPNVVCNNNIILMLGADGVTTYPVSFFDNIYTDNCSLVDTTVMRLTAGCGFSGTEPPTDSLTVCCDDIDKTIEIMFIVEDAEGNTNGCTIEATVVDSLSPVAINCPADMTVSCDSIADLSQYGVAEFEDNCSIDTVIYSESRSLDNCTEGTITRTWIARDESNNKDSCIQVLTVENNTTFDSTVINYPADITLSQCNVDPTDTTITGGVFIDYDGCNTLGLSYEDDTVENGACLVLNRTFTVYDSCTMNTYSDTQNITINNYGDPELTVPTDTIVYVNEDSCTINVGLDAATVTSCSPAATIENNITGGGATVEFNFVLGVTEVIYTATDTCGHTTVDTTLVEVRDTINPVVICPVDTIVGNDLGVCEAQVTLPLPEVSDNCDINPEITNNQNSGSDASGTYGVGVHEITFYVTDTSGNIDSCSFTLIVEDREAPVITCPADSVDIAVDNNCQYTVPDFIDNIQVADNCSDSVDLTYSQIPNAGTVLSGDTTVVIVVSDTSMNSDTCSVHLTAVDTINPEVLAPDTITRALDGDCAYALEDFSDSLTITDNCDTAGFNIEYNPPLGTEFTGTGNEEIEIIVTDASGNSDTVIISLNLIDTIAPVITCPGDTTVEVAQGDCEIFVDVPPPSIVEACGVDTIYNSYTSTTEADSTYSIGITEVTYYVVDSSGLVDSCTFTVTVVDPDPIELICPGSDTLYADGNCQALLPNYRNEVDVMMNCPGSAAVEIFQSPEAGVSIGKDTTVRIIATNGMTSDTCFIDIIFTDTIPPVLSGPDSLTVMINSDCEYVVPDISDTVNVTDNCGADSVVIEQTPSAGDTIIYDGGDSTIVVIATDAYGNTDTLIIVLDVVDNTPPVISCPSDISVGNDPGICGAFVTVPLPGTDNVCGIDSIYNDRTGAGAASDDYPVGTTEVTYYAVDVNGNIDSCKMQVTVTDTMPPSLSCPDTDTTYLNENCIAVVKDYFDSLNIVDNCDGTDVIYNQSIPAGDTISGDTSITIIVEDSSGNIDSCTFDIVVLDSIGPVISGPDTITVIADANCEYEVPNATDSVTITDNCSADSLIITQTPPAGTVIESMNDGDSIVIVVEDGYGNVDSFIITLNVLDTLPPIISCPADTLIGCGDPLNDLSIYGTPSVMNDCDLDTIIEEVEFFQDSCGVDSLIRTFTAIDRSGDSSSCSQIIEIDGMTRPLDREDFILPDTIILESCDSRMDTAYFPDLDPSVNLCNKWSIDTIIDTRFGLDSFYCMKIERIYEIYDSCYHDPGDPEGDVILKQVFFIFDTIAPTVNAPGDITVTAGMDCNADVSLPPATGSDCSGINDFYNNSPFADDSTGSDASGIYPVGIHDITFYASDSCGLDGSDVTTITVLPADVFPITCMPPEGPIALDSDGSITLNANDYVDLSSSCRIDPLYASWNSELPSDSLRIVNCDSLNGGSYTFNGTITVFLNGEPVDECSLTITVNDPNGHCGAPVAGTIYGTVRDWEGSEVPGVGINLVHDGKIIEETTSDVAGKYSFNNVAALTSYSLTFDKEDRALNGVSTYDLLLMYKTILGEDMFTSPYQTLASDINISEVLSLIDVVDLKRIILGYRTKFDDGRSWLINEKGFDIQGYLSGNSDLSYDHKYDIGFFNTEVKKVDLIATKKGDVNNSHVTGVNRLVEYRSDINLNWEIEHNDDKFNLIITADCDLAIEGLQLALNTADIKIDEIYSTLNDFQDSDYRITEEGVRISYIDNSSTAIREGDEIFILKLNGRTSPTLQDAVLNAEVYLEGEQQADLSLEKRKEEKVEANYELYNAQPNPMEDVTTIGFSVPHAETVKLLIYNQNGSRLMEKTVEAVPGYNTVEIKASSLNSNGLYYFRIQAEEFTATKRFIKM